MTKVLFMACVLMVAAGLVVAMFRHLQIQYAKRITLGLVAWLIWVGGLAGSGLLADQALRPPALIFIVAPILIFMVGLVITGWGRSLALSFPVGLLVGAQSFRVAVEVMLHRLWQEGQIPQMLTWAGSNFDVFVGLTAPVAAWLTSRNRLGLWVAQAWTIVGLLMLGNVVVRSALTAPGPLHLLVTEVPNRLPAQFPYAYLVGFLAPLALALHLMTLRVWWTQAFTKSPFSNPLKRAEVNS
jgi:hypothetical protein